MWPPGFHYREDFITDADERVLLEAIADVAFSDFEMRGVVARRRVAFFGQSYDRAAAGPLPAFLLPLRAKIAHWAGVDSDAFAMALINEYRPGTPIGWHRDAPQYDIVAGLSLLSACRMKFRPYRSPFGADVASSVRDTRNCAGPSISVPDDGGIATGVRTSHSAGGTVALLGDVSNAPLSARG